MTEYRLISTKGSRQVHGARKDAIAAARRMDAELRPAYGVTVERLDGSTVAHVGHRGPRRSV